MMLLNDNKKDGNGGGDTQQAATLQPKPQPDKGKPKRDNTRKDVVGMSKGPFGKYIDGIAIKNRPLERSLQEHGIHETPSDFVRRMVLAAAIVAIFIGIAIAAVFIRLGMEMPISIILGLALGIAIYQFALRTFMNFPLKKSASTGQRVERDILFAVRDMIISLRSGMPLYNAIVLASSGYGDASNEFKKIVEKVQLGEPLGAAIDEVIEETKSQSFKRIMLQASVSIKAGSDVVGALQGIIDQLSEERIIALRSYGQKLNAIAMFYMLFGIILPSMGIAVVTILTTFVAIFTVNVGILIAVLIGIAFMQIVFLKLITASRPIFST
jgi:flagellar protein FlaJ